MYRAYNTRALPGEHDNRPLIGRILELRNEKARLLGFRDFADLVLDDRMAHTGDRAQDFLEDLRAKTESGFAKRIRNWRTFAGASWSPGTSATGPKSSAPTLYDFDEEALRPYFPLERVVEGMFEIFGRAATAFAWRRSRACRCGTRKCGITRFTMRTDRNDASRRVLRRLVSAREQARRRVDGRADHRRSARSASRTWA